jgi:ATP-dependent Lhr-like helicase
LQQLRAAPVVGRIWERDVLPLRLASYDPAELAALCQSGELVWAGSGGATRGAGASAFSSAGRAALSGAPPDDLASLSAEAQTVYAFLKSEGALFQMELAEGVGLIEPRTGDGAA